jgi:hypothetical protein
MKFFVKSLPVALVALMLNCSKSSPSLSPLIGTWTKTKTIHSGCTNSVYNNTVIYACPADPNNPLSCDQVTFNSNGTIDIVSSYVDSNIYYHIDELQGTYSVNGTQLTETITGYTITFTFAMSADKKALNTTYKNTNGCTVKDVYTK